MADFVPTTVNRTAVRDLSVPIASVTAFKNLVQSVIDDNPFGCVGYTTSDGEYIEPIVLSREHYTAKVNFLDGNGKRVGTVSLQSPTVAAFEANAAEVMSNTAIAAAMGGEAVRDLGRLCWDAGLKERARFSCTSSPSTLFWVSPLLISSLSHLLNLRLFVNAG